MSDLLRTKIFPSGKCPSEKRKPDNYDPLPWSDYFNYREDLETDVGTFRIYRRGVEGPLLFFLHGGGFSALSWSVLSVDVGRIVMTMYPTEAPPIILIGHSMGGAIAIHSAVKSVVPSLVGLVVIDVVEGSALDALYSMNNYLHSRPSVFRSLQHAIEWSFKSNQIKNIESAKVSFPGQLKCMSTNLPATKDVEVFMKMSLKSRHDSDLIDDRPAILAVEAIPELDEEKDEQLSNTNHKDLQNIYSKRKDLNSNQQSKQKESRYTWRIDLTQTEPYWKGWFKGMSHMFLTIPQPKLLILAGIDRMDKLLMIGQMQGKFQMHVIPQAGHAVHEDVPEKVADCLANFLVRNRFTEAKASCEK